MRLLVTADLHFNHRHSRPLAEGLIAQMNRAGGDGVLVVGDTATADGNELEQCLTLFEGTGPKLFVAGNHELWTRRDDSHAIFEQELPRRVRELGWRWIETDPFVERDLVVVGSVGWYDYAYAPPSLGVPRRFYERKVSPGAADRLAGCADLLSREDDIAPAARQIVARWNDGVHVKLHRPDETFLAERLAQLETHLQRWSSAAHIVAAVHHVPFRELLPPYGAAQWDFAKAYLGSPHIGQLLLRFPNIRHVFCGHSHVPATYTAGDLQAVNIGSGYRNKTFHVLDVSA